MATTTLAPFGGVELSGTAPVTVEHGGGRVDSDIVVEWDLDNDGDFDEAVEDVTAYVMSAETRSGRDWASNLTGKAQPGELRLTLLNSDDRFSYFNQASPLATDPFSLRVGRKIRVRTDESTPVDPVLLARDRFNGADGPLVAAETGQVWTSQLNGGFTVQDATAVAAAAGAVSTSTVATLDVGDADHYVQGNLPAFPAQHSVGLVARFEDSDNYVRAYVSGGFFIFLAETVAGVPDFVDSYAITPWPGMTIGLGVVGTTVTVYAAGVPVLTYTTSLTAGTEAGLYAFKGANTDLLPAVDDFHVWDQVASRQDGVLFTGRVSETGNPVVVGGRKLVTVRADGVLTKAVGTDVRSPRVPRSGNATGPLVGDMMARAGLLHPPAPDGLDPGAFTLGPVGVEDGNTLALARLFEETETGFLHETNEGHVGFQDAAGRAGASIASGWGDGADTQFRYRSIVPLDYQREVVNRVTAGVAPSEPDVVGFSTSSANVALGGTSHTDVVLPTTADGDLLVVFIRRANQTSGVNWLAPIWWIAHRNENPDAIRTRVYSKHCDGTESGATVRFYTDSASAGGAWVAHIYRVQNWYAATQGLSMATFRGGRNPPAIAHGWGRASTLYIACYTGTHGLGDGAVVGTTFPDGYGNGQTTAFTTTGGDVFVSSCYKLDCVEADDPGTFDGDDGFALVESTVFAVRGYNGEHDVLPTIKNPSQFEASPGRFVTREDVESQDEHDAIRSHTNAPNLFPTEAAAGDYADRVLATYADDRPVVTIEFPATVDAAYRAQAVRRRVGDLIHLEADGDAGLGIDGHFFIENVGHRWTDGGKTWEVSWDLSPA